LLLYLGIRTVIYCIAAYLLPENAATQHFEILRILRVPSLDLGRAFIDAALFRGNCLYFNGCSNERPSAIKQLARRLLLRYRTLFPNAHALHQRADVQRPTLYPSPSSRPCNMRLPARGQSEMKFINSAHQGQVSARYRAWRIIGTTLANPLSFR
jgi:hypothetical protein